jgi:hypothetical protein
VGVPYFQSYLARNPNVQALGAKITSFMLNTEQRDFVGVEDAFRTSQLKLTGRKANWHDVWTMWRTLDIGTRLLMYYMALKSIKDPKDYTHWEGLQALLPDDLYPFDGESFRNDQTYLAKMTDIYTALVARSKALTTAHNAIVPQATALVPAVGASLTDNTPTLSAPSAPESLSSGLWILLLILFAVLASRK